MNSQEISVTKTVIYKLIVMIRSLRSLFTQKHQTQEVSQGISSAESLGNREPRHYFKW